MAPNAQVEVGQRALRRGHKFRLARRQGPTSTAVQETPATSTTAAVSTSASTTMPTAPPSQTTTPQEASSSSPVPDPVTSQSTSVFAETTQETTTSAQTSSTSSQTPLTTTSSQSAIQPDISTPSTTVDTTTSPKTDSQATTTSSSRSQSTTVILKTYTSVFTDPNGRLSTQTSVSSSASAVPTAAFNNSSHTGRTWGIVGGVAGGVVLLVAIIFVAYRLTQRRFSNLDDADDDIKWPELLPGGQEVSNQTSTINPLGTRRTNGAGVGDDGDSEFGGDVKREHTTPESFRHTASQEHLVQGAHSGDVHGHRRNESVDSGQHAYPPVPAHSFAMYGSTAPSYHSAFHEPIQEETIYPRMTTTPGATYSPLRGASPPRDGDRPLSMNSLASAYDSAQSHYRSDSRTSSPGHSGPQAGSMMHTQDQVISFGLAPMQTHSPYGSTLRDQRTTSP
ncbi:hypothetical protein OIV83_003381 [Microbotryomycetes sp. JL201]|nr:hypothetical protein OIV83_003381 [Microbotryomycetes sp. JL201]